MNVLQRALKRRLSRLRREGVLGLGLFTVCVVFYLFALQPAQERTEALRAGVAAARNNKPHPVDTHAVPQAPVKQLATYYEFFPAPATAPRWLNKIYAAAHQQHVKLDQGEYRVKPEKVGKLVHYEITLPVNATYQDLRNFTAAVLSALPFAALDQIRFQRQQIGDVMVDAEIKFTLYLGKTA